MTDRATSTSEAIGERPSLRRFNLKISVSAGGGDEDLVVDASEADRVNDLADALASRFGSSGDRSIWCERRSHVLDATAVLERAGIRWGDRLLLVPPPGEPTRVGGAPQVEVIVTGGPCSGQTWTLGDGTYRIGRDPSSDVHLNDVSLSRTHGSIEVSGDKVTITDLESSNGIAIDGKAITSQTPQTLRSRDELELGRTLIRIQPLKAGPAHGLDEKRGRIEFIRPPRVNAIVQAFQREVPAPPSRARKARLPLAASAVPLVMGIAMFVLLKSPFMLVICALSPMMAVTTYLTERRGGKKSFSRGSAEFRRNLDDAATELDGALEAEVSERRRESPDPSTLFERARALEPTVWERRPNDRDFMCLRVGLADLPARSHVAIADGGDQDLRALAERTLNSRRTVPSAPLRVDVRFAGVIGLAGPRIVTEGAARALLLQAAVLHSPGDVAIAAVLGDSAASEWSWLKWLPHVGVDRIGLQTAFASGKRDASSLLADVRDLLADRRAHAHSREAVAPRHATLLLLIDEDAGVDRALVSAALSGAAEHGITAIWLGRDARNLPGQTGSIVEAKDARSVVTVTDVASGESVQDVTVDGVDREAADRAARTIAPIRDISELARAGDIPPRISLLELLDLSPITRDSLEQRWKDWRGRLDATIGVGADGPLTVDLRADGPHALIAGTTGSGKSELLRTFVAAAAATAPPDRLVFLLVDYKGGSAFAPCAALPHVVDVVSDLDEHLAERALLSLEAELKRRERILAQYGAKDLLELQRRAPEEAPPLLVIAVDEFAKLRDEVPEFVDGVVDIAQRGRSLGVHMVLAAQTLRNAFTPAIRANTNLRVALRVADDTESEDVIASPLAARIPSGERYLGRAFARTGHGELREFQTAYVSGRTLAPERRDLELAPLWPNGSGSAARTGDGAFDTDDDNDLTTLASLASDAQAHLGLRLPSPPWCPPLGQILSLDSLPIASGRPACVAIGLVDLPHLQRQDPLLVDLPTAGNVAVFGAGGSGKTTALATTALALARSHSPEQLRIYGLDAGSGDLRCIEALPHCGGVIRMDDEERVERLFRELVRQTEGGSSGQPAGARRVVLLLDDLGTFVSLHDKPGLGTPYEQLQKVVSSGRSAGMHVMFTASRRGAVSGVLAAHVGQRLVLRMPTEEDLLSLGLDAKRVRGAQMPAGRGFTQDSSEFQIAVPLREGETPDFDGAARDISPGSRDATRFATLPLNVPRASLEIACAYDRIPLGVKDADLDTAAVDLIDTHFLVIGSYRSGRSTALATLAMGARQAQPPAILWLLAPRRSPLRDLDIWDETATTSNACSQAIDALVERIGTAAGSPQHLFLFIDDANELGDPLQSAKLERVVRAGRDGGLTVVAAAETSAARGIGISWIREVRKNGHGLLLQPDLLADGDLLGARLPRRVAAPMAPGRGFIVSQGTAELIQVAS
jgi:DNA segregation ATPase FtsK/SpoIIIE, S-DNA-T family